MKVRDRLRNEELKINDKAMEKAWLEYYFGDNGEYDGLLESQRNFVDDARESFEAGWRARGELK